jgi:ATP-binding cassette subfamily F protein uup
MPVIDCTGLCKTYAGRTILRDVDLTIRTAERVGLVGNNGSGKSTLGRILAGVEEQDEGAIARRRGAKIDYLAQEPRLPAGQTVGQVVQGSLSEWTRAKQIYDRLTADLAMAASDMQELVARQAAAGEEVERLGGWERLHEAEAIIGHLGISDPNRSVDSLSGGETRRVALAQVLVGNPDLAILDEPTNHLDVDTIEWLEEHLLSRFRGAALLITHDRYVLDRVTTRTLELDNGAIASYDGGYACYLEAKAERQAHAERVERNRRNFLRRELQWLRRQPKARGTKQKARIGRAQDALAQEVPKREKKANLGLSSLRLGKTIVELASLRIERGGKLLVESLDLALAKGERIGIVGANGTGKTSLLLCLQGELSAVSGRVELGANTRIGYLDQTRSKLEDGHSVREAVAGDQDHIEIAGEHISVGSYLERFLFSHDTQHLQLGVLSGGERARVCLARLLWQKTNLLLLDEPTNDLDVATLSALEEMLIDYGGSAMVVSHDRWFLDRIATSILAFDDGGEVVLHRGNYSEYRERRTDQERAAAKERAQTIRTRDKTRTLDCGANETLHPKQLSFKEQRELHCLFDQIEAAEQRVEELSSTLSDPATYRRPRDEIAALTAKLDEAKQQVSQLTARWEELEARNGEPGA